MSRRNREALTTWALSHAWLVKFQSLGFRVARSLLPRTYSYHTHACVHRRHLTLKSVDQWLKEWQAGSCRCCACATRERIP